MILFFPLVSELCVLSYPGLQHYKIVCYCAQVSAGSQQKSASSKHQRSQSYQSTAAKATENENMTKTVNSSMGKSSKPT